MEYGENYGLSLRYDTNGFTSAGKQIVAKSYVGFTINSDAQTTVLWGGDQLLFWIPAYKLVEGYNGYSHPTFKVMEGATVVNENDETFTLGAATLYFVNGKWTKRLQNRKCLKKPDIARIAKWIVQMQERLFKTLKGNSDALTQR